MQLNPIFNPTGQDDIEHRQMLGGNITNIMNLNSVRYKWAAQLYRQMRENFWIAEKVDLSDDINSYRTLSEEVRRAFDGILSYLTYLDSIQTRNLPMLSKYITAPEVVMCMTEQASQEVLHNSSYQYLIETILPSDKREGIYDLWREDPVLLRRTKFIAQAYQAFWDDPTDSAYFTALCANYILEGLYFYNGFIFFYNLNSLGMMPNTAAMIRYIHRDELTHVRMFQKILPEAAEALGQDITQVLPAMMAQAVEEESLWSRHIIQGVPGITGHSIDNYTQHLANLRLRALGLEELYPDAVNPYAVIEKTADTSSEGNIRGNFFEDTITGYSQSTAVEGWAEALQIRL